jgi:hypothetical protein
VSREAVSDLRLRFLLYQLVRLLAFYHGKGLAFGNLSPRSIFITELLWLRLLPSTSPAAVCVARLPDEEAGPETPTPQPVSRPVSPSRPPG